MQKEACIAAGSESWRGYKRLQGRSQNLGEQDRDILLLKNSLQSTIDGDGDNTEGERGNDD